MKKLTGYEIRNMWLTFFASHGHEIIPSASLVPHDDPTLLWINAGVAPLKKYFDGREKPNNPRMCNAQKSLRTNDIDNVGKTARHHTFFEMLGNFSIGDYFRHEVLEWAYELLFDQKWFAFEQERIYITYYPTDQATYERWIELGIAPDHLICLKDNFWEIGEGPCGPDTEIFFDRGEKYDPLQLGIKMLKEDIENDRYIEIWNIVFSQYNAVSGLSRNAYPELPSKNIDTGSGLERLACIFQAVETNYDTDLFRPMIAFLENYTGYQYNHIMREDLKMAFRVIVDHIRSVTFAVADGAILSNEGRGYVLRRILRRAVRYGRKLGIREPFLYKMVAVVVDHMKDFYTYLVEKMALVTKLVKMEEENFLKTLEAGEKRLFEMMKTSTDQTINGKDAFLLYDTFGFPLELTEEAASEQGFRVDLEEFHKALAEQKQRARNARSDIQSMNTQNEAYLAFTTPSIFIGYADLESNSQIIGIFQDGNRVSSASGIVQLVFDKTPFYAESGGQVGDQGIIYYEQNRYSVFNTVKLPNGQHLHLVDMKETPIVERAIVDCYVDETMRIDVACNHSATHLLNEALRQVLGTHVVQQGSQVYQDMLRFDFNHYQNLTTEEILKVEKIVNQAIHADLPVIITETSIQAARAKGAQAVFGEKYGDVVRLVDMDFSKELCGGTHVQHTNQIQKFAILSIESKGSGIFRIEATTKDQIYPQMKQQLATMIADILDISHKMKALRIKATTEGFDLPMIETSNPTFIGSYQDILNYRTAQENARKVYYELEKQYDCLYREKNSADYKKFESAIETIQGISVLVLQVANYDLTILKDIIDKLSAPLLKYVIFFADVVNQDPGKIIFLAKARCVDVSCGNLVKMAAQITGGNGGGKPDFAQAGGKDIDKLAEAIQKVKEMIC